MTIERLDHVNLRTTQLGAGSERGLKLEHFAFSARDIASVQARLQTMGEPYQRLELRSFNLVQLNLWNPEGNHLHLDFPSDEPSKYQE